MSNECAWNHTHNSQPCSCCVRVVLQWVIAYVMITNLCQGRYAMMEFRRVPVRFLVMDSTEVSFCLFWAPHWQTVGKYNKETCWEAIPRIILSLRKGKLQCPVVKDTTTTATCFTNTFGTVHEFNGRTLYQTCFVLPLQNLLWTSWTEIHDVDVHLEVQEVWTNFVNLGNGLLRIGMAFLNLWCQLNVL